MILTHLKLTNFRGFEDLSLELEPDLTVLVGSNGSGKSSLLHSVRIAATHIIDDLFGELPGARRCREPPRPDDFRLGHERCSIVASWSKPDVEQALDFRLTADGGVQREGHIAQSTGDPPLLIDLGIARTRTRIDHPRSGIAGRISVGGPRPAWDENSRGDGFLPFEHLRMWFEGKENIENADQVKNRDWNLVDPELEAVRSVVSSVLGSEYGKLHGDRPSGPSSFRLALTKGGVDFSEEQLSDGERSLLVMAATIARRLCLLDLNAAQPLLQPALVLIDEVELHLHGKWQRELLPRLRKTFPNVQFIVTTHSPTVLSTLENSKLRILEDFDIFDFADPVRGRDATSLLEDVFGVPERPDDVQVMIDAISNLMDDPNSVAEVRTKLSALIEVLGERDPAVIRIQVLLDFLTRDMSDEPGDE